MFEFVSIYPLFVPEAPMYLHLGSETTVLTKEIIGVFDLDNTTLAASTRHFLAKAQKENRVINTTQELPKSFVLAGGKNPRLYICQLSAATLKKRVEAGKDFGDFATK